MVKINVSNHQPINKNYKKVDILVLKNSCNTWTYMNVTSALGFTTSVEDLDTHDGRKTIRIMIERIYKLTLNIRAWKNNSALRSSEKNIERNFGTRTPTKLFLKVYSFCPKSLSKTSYKIILYNYL